MKKQYYFVTYGCQMNRSDSERIAAVLEKRGYRPVLRPEAADLILVNMCSVRQTAVDRVFGLANKFSSLKKTNPGLKIILTGCVLKKDKLKLAKVFDFIFEPENLPRLAKIISSLRLPGAPAGEAGFSGAFPKIKYRPKTPFSVFVPITSGCNNFCAYCVVPYTRGREISRPPQEIIFEIKKLVSHNSKEIWLLGQNVNSYRGKDRQGNIINFAKLILLINKIPGKFWLRFLSAHPKDFSQELLQAMKTCQKITQYLHLPLQAGDNKVLKSMNRPYTVGRYKKIIKMVRQEFPSISISTDVIVGFPGETKQQFANTIKLFKEIKFDMAYIARYSVRAGTLAAKMKDNVLPKEKKRRWNALNKILKTTALWQNKKYLGKEVEVLADEVKNGFLFGKTSAYKAVKFKGPAEFIGQFVKVKITKIGPWGLKAKLKTQNAKRKTRN